MSVPTMAHVRDLWTAGNFQFIDFAAADVLASLPLGHTGWIAVIGDPNNGAYEWISAEESGMVRRSNAGFGSIASAMLDGLLRLQLSETL